MARGPVQRAEEGREKREGGGKQKKRMELKLIVSFVFFFLSFSFFSWYLSVLIKYIYWIPLLTQLVKNRLQCRRPQFNSWVRKFPWRREWQPIPVFLPGESLG